MIFFLYGEDTYRSREKLNEIVKQYKKTHKSGLNLKYFEADKLHFQNFKEEFQTISMFHEVKLIIIKNVFSNIEFKEKFLKDIERFKDSESIVLFYEGKNIPKNLSLFKALNKNVECQNFEFLKGEKLKHWAKKEIEKYGKKIESNALSKLVGYIDNDLWRFSNEIKKIVNYQKKELIRLEDVDLLVKPSIEPQIFKTIDALSLRDKSNALCLIHQHLENGDHPLYLLTMINYQFRNLLTIKDLLDKHNDYNMILEKAKLSPFVVRKSYNQAGKFAFQELKKIYQKIFQADFKIKTGRIDPETALDLLITEI